jgi:protein-disulfide isomerase
MRKWKKFLMLALLLVPFMSGCTAEKRFAEIEETQKEIVKNQKDILAKLAVIEDNQAPLKAIKKRQPPQVDYSKVYDIPVGNSPVKGNMNAPVTIVEFSDFECPYCAKLQPTLKEVLKTYPMDVRLVYKDFPLSFHKQAKNAARAAHAAGEQGKYWEMHDILFENYNKLADDKYGEFAAQLGLDVKKFAGDFKSGKYDSLIEEGMGMGPKLGIRGTPTLFINGKRMQGRSFDDFKRYIEQVLKK